MTVASIGVVDIFEPGATLMGGKYRLESQIVAHDGVAVWDAIDLHSGRSVQLSVFEHSSAMLDHGRIDRGMFVVFDAPPRNAPRLELVELSDEDVFFDEPPAPELFEVPTSRSARVWLWAAPAVLACALVGLLALYVTRVRTAETSDVTITEARIPAPTLAIPPPPPPEEVLSAAEVDHRAPQRAAPPAPKRPKPAPPARRAPRVTTSDPLTL